MCGTGFLPGIFFGGGAKSTVMQISFVMLIFLLFLDQISGGGVSEGGKLPQGAPHPVEESQGRSYMGRAVFQGVIFQPKFLNRA